MLHMFHLERVPGVGQLYLLRDHSGAVILLVAKVVDEFLIAGTDVAIDQFLMALSHRFELGHA